MEAHKCICVLVAVFALDELIIHCARYCVVDVKERYYVFADASSDVLRQCTVNVNFTGYGDSASGESAVDVAWYKVELSLESRPAFTSNTGIFSVALVCLDPV